MTLSIFDAARDEPTRIALIAGDVRLSFRELAERTAARQAELFTAGVLGPPGAAARPAPLLATPTLATIETLLALLAAGTPALLLHPRSTENERAALKARLHSAPLPRIAERLAPEHPAVVLPTSGTSGAPRLAVLSHGALIAAAHASAAHLGIEDDRWLLPLPLAHVGGLSILVRCLIARRTTVLFDPGGPLLGRLPALAAELARQEVTLLSLVPTVLDRLLDPALGFRSPPSLRALLIGGAACSRSLLERAHAAGLPALPSYGMTETCAQVVTRPYAARFELPPPVSELVSSGVSLPGVQLRIRDGVLEIKGPQLFSGYVGEASPFTTDGWFPTRDRGFFTPEGEIVVTGRSDDVIVTGGENVDPVEVEAALAAVRGVRAACVFGIGDESFGEVVTALLVLDDDAGTPRTLAALKEQLRGRLAGFKLPRRIMILPELPLLPSGKIDKQRAKTLLV
jgi:O-succinylbenzoic acid--CoA ligase